MTHTWPSHHYFRKWHVAWSVPSHSLKQCWHIVNWTTGNKCQWNFNQNTIVFIQENALKNVICKKKCQPFCFSLNVLTLNWRGPSYHGLNMSISWLLMPWLLVLPRSSAMDLKDHWYSHIYCITFAWNTSVHQENPWQGETSPDKSPPKAEFQQG